MHLGAISKKAGMLAAAATFFAVSPMQAISAQETAQQAPRPGEERRPNILFIIADDLNARVAPYGGQAVTPNLDRLAAQGVTFDRAYAQYPWCGPSRASFLTGTRPNTNGIMDLTTPIRANLTDIATLPQYFRDNGYYTARAGKIFHQGVPGGVGRDGLDDPLAWNDRANPSGCDMQAFDRLTRLTPGIPFGGALAYLRDDECGDSEQTDGLVATQVIEYLRQAAAGVLSV